MCIGCSYLRKANLDLTDRCAHGMLLEFLQIFEHMKLDGSWIQLIHVSVADNYLVQIWVGVLWIVLTEKIEVLEDLIHGYGLHDSEWN